MKKSRDWFSTLAIIGGILLVLYPTISNFLNLRNATRVIEQYSEVVDELTDEEAAQRGTRTFRGDHDDIDIFRRDEAGAFGVGSAEAV